MNDIFNYKELIEYIVEVELFYRKYKEKIEINMIKRQKQSVILRILQLKYYNLEINWKTEKIKITRYLNKYEKQQKMKQKKLK